ncbi:MAG: DNA gyrase/topoisomerase IV subunit A [Bacteroidia bacterium]
MSDKKELFEEHSGGGDHNITHLKGMYNNWFLEYASYVILERAVPALEDGMKPVQRRILHAMWELEDGRYNKVANVIGSTMKYHPHGDASIGDAMVQVGQKDLLIDMQGNWGNIFTGDSAAAPRYIEARLSKFALEVVFNPKTTTWQSSYDGRNKEPVTLPVKFPLLLAQGVEGIAVGLACKILPHNFHELIDGSIAVLRGRKADIYPDFPTGGLADFSNYNDGLRGGRIRVRARIGMYDKKTLVINEIPFSTTTGSLIESILAANEKGKIKIRKVEDNTAEKVEILVHLAAGSDPDKTIDALYAFTDCEISISPNACVIENDKPRFVGVNEMLKISTQRTLEQLKKELELDLHELQEKWHFASLEKIFIKEEMYIDFKKYSNKETLYEYLYERFKPHKRKLLRAINDEDLQRLTQIPMIRITRFDSIKADDFLKELDQKIEQVRHHLANLTDYAIEFFKELKKKYGAGRERKTEIKSFENIIATRVVIANEKLYVNREEGFAGYGLKKDEFVSDCSDIDDIIVFRKDGTMVVSKVQEKAFVGKDMLHIAVFKKSDERTTYNMIYRDGPKGAVLMKRFNVTGITRDKPYDLTKGTSASEVLYFSVNPNGEAERVTVFLKPSVALRKLQFDLDFSELAIKSRSSIGNMVTRNPVKKVVIKEKGMSTLGARKVWFDDAVHRINYDVKGTYLGEFMVEDRILVVTHSGYYSLKPVELTAHFDEDIILIEKFDPGKTLTAVYFDGESKQYFVKRFVIDPASTRVNFITEHAESRVELVSLEETPVVILQFAKVKGFALKDEKIKLAEFIEVRNIKAKGNKLSTSKIKEVNLVETPESKKKIVSIPPEELEFENTKESPVEALRRAAKKKAEFEEKHKDQDKPNQLNLF